MDAETRCYWRFQIGDWDDDSWMVDQDGAPDGDEAKAEFYGTSSEAEAEGDRRCELWEEKTGRVAAKITRHLWRT